jgi:spore germination cell wall hydrolase CwlJ-like protein
MRYTVLAVALIPTLVSQGTPQICYAPPVPDPVQHKCLSTMIYGEARGEGRTGKIAVAYSAVNRAKNKTLCDVVLAPKQYSIFNNNPALKAAALNKNLVPPLKNAIDKVSWNDANGVAYDVMLGIATDPTNGSTHYIAPNVMKAKRYVYPKWSRQFILVAVIDNHVFYKQPVKKNV